MRCSTPDVARRPALSLPLFLRICHSYTEMSGTDRCTIAGWMRQHQRSLKQAQGYETVIRQKGQAQTAPNHDRARENALRIDRELRDKHHCSNCSHTALRQRRRQRKRRRGSVTAPRRLRLRLRRRPPAPPPPSPAHQATAARAGRAPPGRSPPRTAAQRRGGRGSEGGVSGLGTPTVLLHACQTLCSRRFYRKYC